MKKHLYIFAALLLSTTLGSCSDDTTTEDNTPTESCTIEVSPRQINLQAQEAEHQAVVIKTDAPSWRIVRPSDCKWVHVTISTGTKGETTTYISANDNQGVNRSVELSVNAYGCEPVVLTVTQEGLNEEIPSELPHPDEMADKIAADQTGMPSTALELARKMYAGINIGNTLEACNNNNGHPDPATWTGGETMWGNPRVTQKLIDGYKAAGFNAVRIPVSWMAGHMDNYTDHRISLNWLARVKQVVDYCYKAGDMYAIINIHWDGGWLQEHPTYDKQEELIAIEKRLWTQIAKYFRNYDEHLLFAGTNEVHFDYNTPTEEHIAVQQAFNQAFVDAVRATGGRNAYRVLVTQTYNTDIGYGEKFHKMSEDPARDRHMLEVHCYTPWDFCGEGDGQRRQNWGSDEEVAYLEKEFTRLEKFYKEGYPFILGEYGALLQEDYAKDENYLAARDKWIELATRFAKSNGYVPFLWDTGRDLFNRTTGTVHSSQERYLKALMKGAETPFRK